MYQNIATKVLTGEVRLSYANLTVPRAPQQGGDPKYSVTLLIPKTDAATVANINASIKAAYEDGVTKKWGGAHPTQKAIVHDGDGLRPSGLPFGDECKGHWVLTASTKSKPQVVGIDNLDCESLSVSVNGAGDCTFAGRADNADIDVRGAGDVDITELRVLNLSKSVKGAGTVRTR